MLTVLQRNEAADFVAMAALLPPTKLLLA